MEMTILENLHKPRKRLFIGLLAGSLLALVVLLGIMWYLFINRMYPFHRFLLVGILSAVILILIVIAVGIGGIVYTLWRSKTIPLGNLMRVPINVLFPVVITLGKILGFDKEKIRSSFVEVNNQLVKTRHPVVPPEKILILLPHCLQVNHCPHKVTVDVENCKRCGGCSVDSLMALKDRYGVKVAVATGGTLARKFVSEWKPKAVVAVACERDLTSGILDINPLPVLGVLNDRPNGPCFNTCVNINRVEEAIKYYLGED
ncbi:MAG: DUF116 domain-containing protein [Clostridia bacterium]|nr:DUF116 domain-containing protein [Clostridia bacterium]